MAQKAQHAILRFAKHKAGPAGALEAHHERTKEKYASNPDIDISKSKDNFHIIQPTQKYRKEIDTRIKAAGCRTRKDSTMFVDTLITASPEFFTGRSKKGDFGQPGAAFKMAGRVSRPHEKGVPRPQAGRERPCHQAQAHSHMVVQAVRRPHPATAGHRKGGVGNRGAERREKTRRNFGDGGAIFLPAGKAFGDLWIYLNI